MKNERGLSIRLNHTGSRHAYRATENLQGVRNHDTHLELQMTATIFSGEQGGYDTRLVAESNLSSV